ncbi:unnamed protein product [Arabidopsis halleri]
MIIISTDAHPYPRSGSWVQQIGAFGCSNPEISMKQSESFLHQIGVFPSSNRCVSFTNLDLRIFSDFSMCLLH